MAEVDFSIIRREIRNAARLAFDVCQARHPSESFYAFALFSDDSAMTVCPAAITEQAYDNCVKRERENEQRTHSLASLGVQFADYGASYLRWGLAEGVYEYGHEDFRKVYDMINVEGRYDDDDPDGFVNFKGRLFALMVLGLKDLDVQGYFGSGELRERVTLLCGVSDSACDVWLRNESARWLNSPTVFERFWGQWTRDRTVVEDFRNHCRKPGSVWQAFLKYLKMRA